MSHIQKSTASNIDLEIIELTVSDMVARKSIDKDSRILNESCNSFTLPRIPYHHVETLDLEKGSQSPQKAGHKSIANLNITPLASLQRTTNLLNSISKFNAIKANLMAIKSNLIYEVYKFRNEISSLKSMFYNSISTRRETDNQITTGTLKINILETRSFF